MKIFSTCIIYLNSFSVFAETRIENSHHHVIEGLLDTRTFFALVCFLGKKTPTVPLNEFLWFLLLEGHHPQTKTKTI